MPIYRYQCPQCSLETEELVFSKTAVVLCKEDQTELTRLPSAPSPSIIKERLGLKNKSVRRDIGKELKKRSHEHFVNHEMSSLIEKYGVKQAESLGWVDKKTGKKKRLLDEK